MASVLPIRTGTSLFEAELNPHFIAVTNLILQNSKPLPRNGHQDFLSEMLEAFTDLLASINIDPTNKKIIQRTELALASLLIILKLVRVILLLRKSPSHNLDREEDLFMSMFDDSAHPGLTKSEFLNHEFLDLPPLAVDLPRVLETIFALISPDMNIAAFSKIRGKQVRSEPPDYSVEIQSLLAWELKSYILQIDSSLIIMLRYISVSNPKEYLNFVYKNLHAWSSRVDSIPTHVLQRYACLLKFVHYSLVCEDQNLKRFIELLANLTSTTWRQVVLYYNHCCIRNACIQHRGFYTKHMYSGSPCELSNRQLFEYISSAFDLESYAANFLYSSYILFCPSDLEEVVLKPYKLKHVFNRRVKFLQTILKDSHACMTMDAFEGLTSILQFASMIDDDSSSLRKFALKFVNETFNDLQRMELKCHTETLRTLYRALYVKLYTAAIGIYPAKYIASLKIALQSLVEKFLATPEDTSCLYDLEDIFNVLKLVSPVTLSPADFKVLMQEMNPSITQVMHKVTSQLAKFEKKVKRQSNNYLDNPPDNKLGPCSEKADSQNAISTLRDLISPAVVEKASSKESARAEVLARILRLALEIYTIEPAFFLEAQWPENSSSIVDVVNHMPIVIEKLFPPLEMGLKLQHCKEQKALFAAACEFLMQLLLTCCSPESPPAQQCLCLLLSHEIIIASCEMLGRRLNLQFTEYFLILGNFLQERYRMITLMPLNPYFRNENAHYGCRDVCSAMDKLFMISLCTHNNQFLSLAKLSTRAYTFEANTANHRPLCFKNSFSHSLAQVMLTETELTGFVTLHKKIKAVLLTVEPTTGLYEAYLFIHEKWQDMVANIDAISESGFSFKHYTEFLVTVSGCFLENPTWSDVECQNARVTSQINAFFTQAADLLKSSELYVRVVIKDAFSSESSPIVYQLIYRTLIKNLNSFKEMDYLDEELVLVVEESISIFTAILSSKGDNALVIGAFLPELCQTLLDFVPLVPNLKDQINLKLRLPMFTTVISADRERFGLAGAHKLRNFLAKTTADWLDLAVSYEPEVNTPNAKAPYSEPSSEIEFLQVELACECSKSLEAHLKLLVLGTSEGSKESTYKQTKEIVFSGYFSLFYKIFQKYKSDDPSPLMIRSKFKIQALIDNVLKAISNMLQANVDIGLQFALPLGFHENDKIRSIFLKIFADTLSVRQSKLGEEEFSDAILDQLSEVHEIYGAAAQMASLAEHNLLATSLHGLYGYTKRLDQLFLALTKMEIDSVTRSSDIFRGNSTLTRLMSIFAKEYGIPYLTVVLKPFIEEMAENDVTFEVEKDADPADIALFCKQLTILVDTIVNSMPWVPESFRFICFEIYRAVKVKFKDAALMAVGSFLFLRFFCPAIVSPESFFGISGNNSKVKRSLMQLVKVIQYMANGSINNLKWSSLTDKSDELNNLSNKIFEFMEKVASDDSTGAYPFHKLTVKPLTSVRYIHKFIHTYYIKIRKRYLIGEQIDLHSLRHKIATWGILDRAIAVLGNPKSNITLQGSTSFKLIESQFNIGNSQFTEFMAKMSAKNIETSLEMPVIQNSVFHDGTPTLVINFRQIKEIGYDVNTFVYLIFESASHIWDNSFYCVFDFTQFFFMGIIGKNYISLMRNFAPMVFFKNCKKTYYYNLPRYSHLGIIESMGQLRATDFNQESIYFYSEQDDPSIINNLCLNDSTLAIIKDVRIVCKACKLYDNETDQYMDVILRVGRHWLLIWFEKIDYKRDYTATASVAPVEVHRISDLTRCEITNRTGCAGEFTIYLNRYNYSVTLSTPKRQEIMRFLYFAMLRTTKKVGVGKTAFDEPEQELEVDQRFSTIANLVFHGLLNTNDEVRKAASKLQKSFSLYFDLHFDHSSRVSSMISFPVNMTDYVVAFSSNLREQFPSHSPSFIKAFLANFDKLPDDLKVSGICYVSPWLHDLHKITSREEKGSEDLTYIIRQFCRITVANKRLLPFMNDFVWKKLFRDMRLNSVLIDELLAISMESASDVDDWETIFAIFFPSAELCGELVCRLHDCISSTKMCGSEMAIQSKILEITILVKLCATVFFNSHVFGSLYLLDVFLFCVLFIDRPDLDFGSDLQRLVINTVHSFAQRPNLSARQLQLIVETVEYFSSQRAKMLFGLTFKERGVHGDFAQNFDRALSFELLCDYLNDFITEIGTAEDRKYWVSRWASLAKDIALGDSLFQRRAFTVVCTLARSGISDSVGGRFMKILAGPSFDDFDTIFEGYISFYRLKKGFTADSVYLPLLIWVVAGAAFLELPNNYQAVISGLSDGFKIMIDTPSFTKKVFDLRPYLEPLVLAVESKVGVEVNEDNYRIIFLYLFSRGLTMSQFRHTSISVIRSSLNEMAAVRDDHGNLDTHFVPFLLIYYLSVSETEFEKFIEQSSFYNDILDDVRQRRIPEVLLSRIRSGCPEMQFAFVLAAYIFSNDCELVFKMKFVKLYKEIFETLRSIAMMVFHIIRTNLETAIVDSTSSKMMIEVSYFILEVLKDLQYDEAVHVQEIDGLCKRFKLQRPDRVGQFRVMDESEALLLMYVIRQMFYRNISNAVEGLRLEKY